MGCGSICQVQKPMVALDRIADCLRVNMRSSRLPGAGTGAGNLTGEMLPHGVHQVHVGEHVQLCRELVKICLKLVIQYPHLNQNTH